MNRELHETAKKLITACNCCASSIESVNAAEDYLEEYGRQGLIELIREFLSHATELRRDARDLERLLDLDFMAAYQAEQAAKAQAASRAAA